MIWHFGLEKYGNSLRDAADLLDVLFFFNLRIWRTYTFHAFFNFGKVSSEFFFVWVRKGAFWVTFKKLLLKKCVYLALISTP